VGAPEDVSWAGSQAAAIMGERAGLQAPLDLGKSSSFQELALEAGQSQCDTRTRAACRIRAGVAGVGPDRTRKNMKRYGY